MKQALRLYLQARAVLGPSCRIYPFRSEHLHVCFMCFTDNLIWPHETTLPPPVRQLTVRSQSWDPREHIVSTLAQPSYTDLSPAVSKGYNLQKSFIFFNFIDESLYINRLYTKTFGKWLSGLTEVPQYHWRTSLTSPVSLKDFTDVPSITEGLTDVLKYHWSPPVAPLCLSKRPSDEAQTLTVLMKSKVQASERCGL